MANYIFHDNNRFSHNPLPCGDYLIYQIGEMYCKEDTVIQDHTQQCAEITFVVDGMGTSCAQNVESISANDCFFSFQDEFHAISTDTEKPLRFHFLGFNPIKSTQGEKYISILKQYIYDRDCRVINLPELHNYIDEILFEIKHGNYLFAENVGVLISKMLIAIIRAYAPSKENESLSPQINSEALLIYKIIDYLDSNVSSIKNLKELEEKFNYNYNYMSAVFARVMHFSINDYFRKIKMQKAKEMLQKDISITAISEALHYSSVHAFSRAFKSYFGIQPSEYRNGNID